MNNQTAAVEVYFTYDGPNPEYNYERRVIRSVILVHNISDKTNIYSVFGKAHNIIREKFRGLSPRIDERQTHLLGIIGKNFLIIDDKE